jgi:transposase
MEDWTESRRLHRREGMPIAVIARALGISRNRDRRVVNSAGPPRYVRPVRGSAVDRFEPAIRELLAATPSMTATVIAQRVSWDGR